MTSRPRRVDPTLAIARQLRGSGVQGHRLNEDLVTPRICPAALKPIPATMEFVHLVLGQEYPHVGRNAQMTCHQHGVTRRPGHTRRVALGRHVHSTRTPGLATFVATPTGGGQDAP